MLFERWRQKQTKLHDIPEHQSKYWTTNDAEEIEIKNLGDLHLVNIVKLLERKPEIVRNISIHWLLKCQEKPELIENYHNAWLKADTLERTKNSKLYLALTKELKNRNLQGENKWN